MNYLTDTLDTLFDNAIRHGVFPGGVFGISYGQPTTRQTVIKAYGNLWATGFGPANNPAMSNQVVFDLASLTKPLATALSILCLKNQGMLCLNDRLSDLLEQPVPVDKKTITLAQFLQHNSGLPAHRPYFESLRALPVGRRKTELLAMLLAEPLVASPGETVIYSDLGYMLLGLIVEKKTKHPFNTFVKERLYAPLGLAEEICFNPINAPTFSPGTIFAPTELCPWRQRILYGEVHDDNAHAMGGVAGHAGLFGRAQAVLTLSRFLLDLFNGETEHPLLLSSDLHEATNRRIQPGNTWGLGFDTPSATQSSAGDLLSRLSFGHLGFTGTSFWCDPERNLAIVLLTNRVHPSRDNTQIREFRPRFHDAVVRSMEAITAGVPLDVM